MKNRVEVAGYAAFGVGLLVTAALMSPGFTVDALPVAITVGLGAFAVSLVCLGVSAVWTRVPPAAAVPLHVRTGDHVLFGKYSGQEIRIQGKELLIMREEEVPGVVDERDSPAASLKHQEHE
jgi:hypothetical protein